jgi:glycosyltransferase involved in cell wall biosynthesis
LLAFLQTLAGRSMPFRLSVVGEGFRRYPEAFDQIHRQFADQIKHWGFLESREQYDQLLGEADIVLSTALHDFQGLAVLEAMASGCVALAPDRLAYREYVPESGRYRSDESSPEAEARAAVNCLEQIVVDKPASTSPDAWRASRLTGRYQALLDDLIAGR